MKVINLRDFIGEVAEVGADYVFGGRDSADPRKTPPGQKGWLGNPFRMYRESERQRVIQRFRDYFLARVEHDSSFREQVLALRDKTVACFCAPKLCHLDVVKDWLEQQGKEEELSRC